MSGRLPTLYQRLGMVSECSRRRVPRPSTKQHDFHYWLPCSYGFSDLRRRADGRREAASCRRRLCARPQQSRPLSSPAAWRTSAVTQAGASRNIQHRGGAIGLIQHPQHRAFAIGRTAATDCAVQAALAQPRLAFGRKVEVAPIAFEASRRCAGRSRDCLRVAAAMIRSRSSAELWYCG